LLGFILLGVLVRLLPPAQFGVYSAVIAIYTITVSISLAGQQFAGTRFVALLSKTDPEKAWVAARRIIILSLLFGGTCAAILTAISPQLSLYFARTTDYTTAFVFGALYVFAATISTIFQSFVQGMRKYDLLAKILLLSRILALALTVIGLLEFRSVIIPLATWILFNLVIALWGLKIFGKDLLRARGEFEYSTILRYSIPLGIGAIVYAIANYADQIFVGGYLNTVDLAIYSAAVLVSTAIGGVLFLPINTAFLPEASRLETKKELSNGMRLAIRYAVLTILPASMIQAGVSGQILSLFSGGSVYLQGTTSLQVLSLLFIFVPLQGLVTALLQAVGQTMKAMVLGIAMVASVVLFSIILIPIFRIEGAALANALISLVGFLIGVYYTKDFLGMSKTYFFYAKVAVGSTAALIVTLTLSTFVSSRTLTVIPYALIGGLIFLISVRNLNMLTDEDRSNFTHIIPSSFRWILRYL
jgi:stage V sporulation protein B